MIAFLKNCWKRRCFRGAAWTLVILVTVWVLFCSWFDWMGARALKQAMARLEQEKETLDFRKLVADPVPDESNFCAIPMLSGIALVEDSNPDKGSSGEKRKQLESLGVPTQGVGSSPAEPRGAASGDLVDLKPWADRMRSDSRRAVPDSGDPANNLLAMLSKDDARFAELAAALNREHSQWTPSWKTRELPGNLFAVPLPHFEAIRALERTLCLRSVAAARKGDSQKAHESLLIAIRLNEATLQEPFLIGTLVAVASSNRITSEVWELSRAKAGSAADFARLQKALERCDLHQSALRAYRSELAGAASTVLWMDRVRDPGMFSLMNEEAAGRPPVPGALVARLIPSGWFTSNAASIVNLDLDYLVLPARDLGLAGCARRAFEVKQTLQDRQKRSSITNCMALLTIPAISLWQPKVCYAQGQLDQAVAACALERYRLENGNYPDSLSQVKRTDGRDLPLDVYSGKPMGYRKTDNGRYVLWCTGPDGKDDGGKRVLDSKKPESTKFSDPEYQGDWVWDYPEERNS